MTDSLEKRHKLFDQFFDLRGEVAIVTGGLGLLGSQYAKTLYEAGASVGIFDIKTDKHTRENHPILFEFFKDCNSRMSSYPVDITNEEHIKRAMKSVESSYGTPTILINNAGIDTMPNADVSVNGPFEDYKEEAWDAVIDTNLKGAFLMSKRFIKGLRPTGKSGSIINISSTYGVVAPDQAIYEYRRKKGELFYKPVSYTVSKAGMIGLTLWLAEYGKPNIRANALVLAGVYNNQDPEFVIEYEKRIMLGRMARSDEYNAIVLYLASSKASSFATGGIFTVDGGWTAR